MNDSPEHRDRVRAAIQTSIWMWLRDRYVRGPRRYHESELIGLIVERHGCAHESVSRIVRDLRQRNVVVVESVRRGTREYEVVACNQVACEPMPREREQLGLFGKGAA